MKHFFVFELHFQTMFNSNGWLWCLKMLPLHPPPFLYPPLSISKLFFIHHSSNCPAWLHTLFDFSDSFTCTPTFICHLSHTPPFPLIHPQCASLFPVLHSFPSSEESEYHTDYEEEAVESALSDMELYSRYGEHTEGEETADTVRNLWSHGWTLWELFC